MSKTIFALLCISLMLGQFAFAQERGTWKYESMGISGTVTLDETDGRSMLIRKFHDGSRLNEELLKKDNSTYISATIHGQYYIIKDNKLFIYDTQGLIKILNN